MEQNFQFLIYRSAEENVSVNAIVKDESVWLTQEGKAVGAGRTGCEKEKLG